MCVDSRPKKEPGCSDAEPGNPSTAPSCDYILCQRLFPPFPGFHYIPSGLPSLWQARDRLSAMDVRGFKAEKGARMQRRGTRESFYRTLLRLHPVSTAVSAISRIPLHSIRATLALAGP